MMKEFTCMRGGLRIYGRTHVPDTGLKNYPTVIMCHGFNGSCMGNVKYAEQLVPKGFACVMFDFCGGSLRCRSGGDMREMTVSSEIDDLKTVTGCVKEMEFADTERLILMGKSQGGFVSALAAADMKDDISALVLLYPAFTIPLMAKRTEREMKVIPEEYEILGGVVGREYLYDALSLDTDKCFTYGGDVLILHGDRDDIVPLSSSKRAEKLYRSAELHIIEGAGHGFRNGEVKRACELMSVFLKNSAE